MKGLQEPLIRTNTESSFSMENPNRPSLEVGRGHNSLTSNKDGNIRYRRTSALKSSRLDTGKMMAGRLYAVNAPKIFLETITARTSLIIIVVTYAVFLIGFSIDIWTTYQGFTDSNYVLSAYTCTKAVLNGGGTWGCSHAYQWNSTVTQLTNVLSVKLSVQQTNVTYLFSNSNITSSFDIDYNVNLWACYDAGGCGKNFKNDDTYTDNPNVWQKVLFLDNQKIKVNQNSDYSSENGGTISSLLISNTFQNQEAIPTNGLVKSYFMNVQYTNDPYNLYSGVNQDALPYLTYNFDVLTRPQQPGQDALTIVLLVFTVALLAFYLYIILPQKKILSEQKWLISYFLLLIMFQNPVYCVIVWFNPAAKPGAAYASYFLSDLSQAGLFVLWLLFADTVHRKTRKWWVFYGPKVAIGFFIFLSSLIILTFQFPGVSTTNRRDALEAVANWSTSYQVEFIVFTIMFLALIWIWTFAWCVRLYLTAKQLKRLPYMTTRYIQLSYRFFSLQATLVTIYYVFQYAFVIYFISYRVGNNYDATSFTDNINTLFRQQTQLFGKTLFLTVYATILCFLFLPSNLLDNSPIKTALAATYVITEEEHRKLIKLRKEVFHNMKKNFLHQVTLMNQIVNAKVDVFCVDIGLKMRNCSFQVYYDLPEINTESGYEGASADLDSIGYELIKHFYIEQHEIICYILREKVKLRIVVVFRGTASKRQMEDNLKYKKVKFNLDPTGLLAVDQYDGLNFKETDDTRFELESVSDDETDDIELEDEREQGFARSLSDSLNHPSKAAESLFQPSMADGGYSARTANFRETMANRVDTVRETVSKAFTGAVDVTGQGINVVVGATTDLMTTAASKTPGLKDLVGPHVHLGFYTAYLSVRPFIHEVLRTELKKFPTTVFFTGHSLGGALATLAALDVSLNTIPRVNAYLKHQEKLKLAQQFRETGGKMSLFQYYNRSHSETDTKPQLETLERASSSDSYNRSSSLKNRSSKGKSQPVFVKKIKVMMYNFGSPRVGNYGFKQLYDRVVPSSFRVVVDGDVVPGLPPTGYDHIGTEILVDSLGAGSVIIDPSFVERWLRTQTKSSVTVHSLIYYQKGLLGLKYAAEYIKKYAKEIEGEQFDPVQLVIQLRNEHKIEQLVEGHEDLVGTLAKGEETSSKSMADSVTSETRPSIVEEPQKIQKQRPDSNESIDSVVVSQQRQQALNEVHYKRDERNMQELMSQIHGIQKNDPIEWLKKNTVQRFRRARSSNEGHKSTEKDVENQIHRARSESSVIEE